MKLSSRSKSYIIPEYNLTGDLLSFLTCNLQYRYQNKGTLPPSMPVQLWFGEFIHGVLEEAFLKYKTEKTPFPWDWKNDIRPLEDIIDLQLQIRGLYPPKDYFFSTNHPDNRIAPEDLDELEHKKLASARAEKAINVWGSHLFPLIGSAEVLIKGIREMPNYDENYSRSNYYGINGVVDVLSSLRIEKAESEPTLDNYQNKIIQYLKEDETFRKTLKDDNIEDYEMIIDYKGMKRPPLDSDNWKHHLWQILTYSWLREKQEDAKPIKVGIILYINELVPSTEDIMAIKEDIINNNTDVKLLEEDWERIKDWNDEMEYPYISDESKERRSIRIINIDEAKINLALSEFDNVVNNIENSLIKETKGCSIKESWKADGDKRTCSACDFRTFCTNSKHKSKDFKIP